MHRSVLTLAVVLVVTACDRRGPDVRSPAPVASPTAPATEPAPHDAPSLDDLRAAHPTAATDEGVACADDRDCASPLRCADAACLWPPALTGDLERVTVRVVFQGTRLPEATYHLEVAASTWERTRGLMHRRSMVRDMGMLFVFDRDEPRSFWMRETYIPLDMVFVTDAGVVDSVVENARPLTETIRASDGPARFVVELVAGEAARIGLQPGSTVTFQGLTGELAPVGE